MPPNPPLPRSMYVIQPVGASIARPSPWYVDACGRAWVFYALWCGAGKIADAALPADCFLATNGRPYTFRESPAMRWYINQIVGAIHEMRSIFVPSPRSTLMRAVGRGFLMLCGAGRRRMQMSPYLQIVFWRPMVAPTKWVYLCIVHITKRAPHKRCSLFCHLWLVLNKKLPPCRRIVV